MSKFNFEESTVGDILDDEKANALFWELVPEAKDYENMLEIGRPFTIEQALPFIIGIAEELGIPDTQERIDNFRTKLEELE